MTKLRTSRQMLPILAVVAIMIVAGGAAIASNAGFKLNMGVTIVNPAGSGQHGNNWLSLPYFNPYLTVQDFCDQTGLVNLSASLVKIDIDGVPSTIVCGGAGSGNPGFFEAGQAVRLRAPAGNPSNLIIVGSHDPTETITIPTLRPAGSGAQDNVWLSIPYHTTWVNQQDICDGLGLNSTIGPGLFPDTLFTIDPAPINGGLVPHTCNTAGNDGSPIQLGRGYRIRRSSGLPDTVSIPAHF